MVPSHKVHSCQLPLGAEFHHIVREEPGYVIYSDVAGGRARIPHQGGEQGLEQYRVCIAHGGLAGGIVVHYCRTVDVGLDCNLLPGFIAALALIGKQSLPALLCRRLAAKLGDALVHHLLYGGLVKVGGLPPVAAAVPAY